MVNSNRDHFQHAIEHMTEIHRKWPGIFDEMVTRRIPINEFKAALNNPPRGYKIGCDDCGVNAHALISLERYYSFLSSSLNIPLDEIV